MRQNFAAQFVHLLTCWLCNVQLGVVMEKNWVHSVDQCRLQALQFSVHRIGLLSILLKCNGFARIQKAVVDQTPADHQTVTVTFFGTGLALESAFEFLLSPTTELVIAGCHIKSIFCQTSQSNREMICCYCIE